MSLMKTNNITQSTVQLDRNDMKFSSAHFTIFSATERERLHGHNYQVCSKITAEINNDGITYDYSLSRRQILDLCKFLHEYMLLPQYSPHLDIVEQGEYIEVTHNKRKMFFLKDEVRILPIANVTSECLAQWFVDQLTADKDIIQERKISAVEVSISTTVGQRSIAKWQQ
jgi:6-pyruvoyltetrahydropterin/6-carboxytetrahydropterin synthase